MLTGEDAWLGFPPEVTITERMLYSQLPEEHKVSFMQFLGTRYGLTRSGEPVFPKIVYERWKQLN